MKVRIHIDKTIDLNKVFTVLFSLIGLVVAILLLIWGYFYYQTHLYPALLYNDLPALTDGSSERSYQRSCLDLPRGMEDEERTRYVLNLGRIEGVNTLWYYQAKQDEVIEISYQLSVPRGKAKLVYVSPSWKTTTLAERSQEESDQLVTTTLAVKKGENRIKVACGLNTEIHMKLQIKEGWFTEWTNLIGAEKNPKPITSTLPQ